MLACLLLLLNVLHCEGQTIVETAIATPSLSSLVQVLSMPGYEPILQALNEPGTFTVFAPNNEAFARANIDWSNVEKGSAWLYHHVLGSVVTSGDLVEVQFPETLSNDPKYVTLGGKGQVLFIVKSRNSVMIYFSDKVAVVVAADVMCSNGVVHIISEVVELPPLASKTVNYSGLTTLLDSVVKAGLVDAVDTTASITIFCPTNDAFARAGIDPSTTPADVLANVLTYHVVPAVAYTTDVTDGLVVPTLQGGELTLTIRGGEIFVNGVAQVTVDNVLVRNGVLHFIDHVLLPSANITNAPKITES
jgi:transforming growth factor-beta-induced protein